MVRKQDRIMQSSYNTLSEAVEGLKAQGYVEDFTFKEDCIHCSSVEVDIRPESFVVDQMYRFEGMSDPSDSSVIYAITSESNGLKGILIDAYGAYSSPLKAEMIEKLRYRP